MFAVFGRGGLDVIPNAEVESEVRQNAPVILEEDAVVEVVRVGIYRNVLPHRVRRAEQEVGNCGRRTVRRVGVRREAEDAVVVQRRLLSVVLAVGLAAVVQRVMTVSGTHNVADGVEVGAGDGTGDGVAGREPAADCELRTRAARLRRNAADGAVRNLLLRRPSRSSQGSPRVTERGRR